MKFVFPVLMALGLLQTFGQGTMGYLRFETRVAGLLDAPIQQLICSSTQCFGDTGPGPAYSAGLFIVRGGSTTLIPESVTTFQAPPNHYYVHPVVAGVPGTIPGESVTLRFRGWMTSAGSYEAANHVYERFEVHEFTTFPLGAADSPVPVVGISGATVGGSGGLGLLVGFVPEPTTLSLAALGGLCMLLLNSRRLRQGI